MLPHVHPLNQTKQQQHLYFACSLVGPSPTRLCATSFSPGSLARHSCTANLHSSYCMPLFTTVHQASSFLQFTPSPLHLLVPLLQFFLLVPLLQVMPCFVSCYAYAHAPSIHCTMDGNVFLAQADRLAEPRSAGRGYSRGWCMTAHKGHECQNQSMAIDFWYLVQVCQQR